MPVEKVARYLGHTNPNVKRATHAEFGPEYLARAAGALDLWGRIWFDEPERKPLIDG